jgi:hypothetical protein
LVPGLGLRRFPGEASCACVLSKSCRLRSEF